MSSSGHGSPTKSAGDWQGLQRKIFTRWVNQKLVKGLKKPLDDVVTDLGKGSNLVDLLEVLTESKCTKKIKQDAKFKAQILENLALGLQWMTESGVQMSLKPSADNLYEGDDRAVLGLVWALMMKYLKFAQEDDESLSPKEALLRWVNLNVGGYGLPEATSFTKSFRDGKILCALLHKFRPKLLDWDGIKDTGGGVAALDTAMNVAEQFFGLERYLEPAEITQLDDKSMLVYVSEYYSGITAKLKLDLAARRIAHLITFTRTNDALKSDYLGEAGAAQATIDEYAALLGSLGAPPDDTFSGATERVERFTSFKAEHKSKLFGEHIQLQAIMTNLATRLADNNRPEFVPAPPLDVHSRARALDSIQDTEQGVGAKLYIESNRQHRLRALCAQHAVRHAKLAQWVKDHGAQVPEASSIGSSGQGTHFLKLLESETREIVALRAGSVARLTAMGAELATERFESLAVATERETALERSLTELSAMLTERKPGFEDAVARHLVREQVERSVSVHADLCAQVQSWCSAASAYLDVKEDISNVDAAELQLSLLDAHVKERGDMLAGVVAALKAVGADIRSTEYRSEISLWTYPKPEVVLALEGEIDAAFVGLEASAAEKKLVLEDDLARELFAQETRLLAGQHRDKAAHLMTWAADKAEYLAARESCDTVARARALLGAFTAYEGEIEVITRVDVASLKILGASVLARKYESTLSTYVYEDASSVRAREADVDGKWGELAGMAADKLPFLRDHLARNVYQNKVRNWVRSHADAHAQLSSWVSEKRQYLAAREDISSVNGALLHLALLKRFGQDSEEQRAGTVAALVALGEKVRQAEYKTEHSAWKYEKPDIVMALEAGIESDFGEALPAAAATKQAILDDHLARETFKEQVRLWVRGHGSKFADIERWLKDKIAYLDIKEDIDNSQDALVQLSILEPFDVDKKALEVTQVAALNALGEKIRAAEYKTEHSAWIYEEPGAITALETNVQTLLDTAAEKKTLKKKVLADDLARWLFIEKVRLWVQGHRRRHADLSSWCAEKLSYLATKEIIANSAEARIQISILEPLPEEIADIEATGVSDLKRLGVEICEAKYATPLSSWQYEAPEEVKALETAIDEHLKEIASQTEKKREVLEDDLKRELYAEETRLMADQHKVKYTALHTWSETKLAYLGVVEEVKSTEDARYHINLLETFESSAAAEKDTAVAALFAFGREIVGRKYAWLTGYTYEYPEEMSEREASLNEQWAAMASAAADKMKRLRDDLARNEFQDSVRTRVSVHTDAHGKIAAWATTKLLYLGVREELETVPDSELHLGLLRAYVREREDKEAGAVVALTTLGDEIRAAEYKSELSAWKYEEPGAVTALETNISSKLWGELAAAEKSKSAFLDDAAARNVLKRKVLLLARRHDGLSARINVWADGEAAYLALEEDIGSLADSSVALRILEAHGTERDNISSTSVSTLRELGAEVLSTKYRSQLSTWDYPTPDDISSAEAAVAARWDVLTAAAKAKLARLEAAQKREETKEGLRQDIALAADAMEGLIKDTCLLVAKSSSGGDKQNAFGFSLADVQRTGKELKAEDEKLSSEADARQSECTALQDKLDAFGAVDNPYTAHTRETLAALRKELSGALSSRVTDYEAELARHTHNDDLCKRLAAEVDPTMAHLRSAMKELTEPKGSLEEQLAVVEAAVAKQETARDAMRALEALGAQVEAAAITFNPYTSTTAADVLAQFGNYDAVLARKIPLLKKEIEFKRLSGVSPEQMAEIESFFEKFDSDQSHQISPRELKACLFSLGEELTTAEVAAHIAKFGGGGKALNLEQFKKLMIHLTGITQDPAHIVTAFRTLARHEEVAPVSVLKEYFEEEGHRDFITDNAPKVGDDGYAYKPFVAEIFKR
eukprot:UC1_evm2s1999